MRRGLQPPRKASETNGASAPEGRVPHYPNVDGRTNGEDNLPAMIRLEFISCIATSFALLSACNSPSVTPKPQIAEHYIPDPGSVGFIASQRWLATYTSQGKTAKFRIELGAAKPLNDKESQDFNIQQGEGRFIAEPGSDASILLADLKKSLEAKKLPTKVKRMSSLPFVFITLGIDESQAPGGGFNDQPPGNWRTMKIFIGKGEQEGDMFLNLNPVIKKGQFSIKDPDYGDILLAQLAQVL
jgi:hypothetical protein